jgi:hypothetical protein
VRGEAVHRQAQQDTAGRKRGPGGTVQHPVIGLEMRMLIQAHDTQHGSHGAFADGKDGT